MASSSKSASQTESSPTKKLSLKEKYPEIYAQTNIDRRGCERVVPMEILSLGMGRTGTMCKSCFLVFSPLSFLEERRERRVHLTTIEQRDKKSWRIRQSLSVGTVYDMRTYLIISSHPQTADLWLWWIFSILSEVSILHYVLFPHCI